jgi:AraC family transcriptional regulator of adaptative response/methylated-DNA-[protein]-cysteine methyltransferase
MKQPAYSESMSTYWKAVLDRDVKMDGVFYYAVRSTHVYCRPSCPSRRPNRENVLFFERPDLAEQAGFRACLRCQPRAGKNPRIERIERACRYIETHLDAGVDLATLGRETGLSPFHLQRTFKAVTGVTPRAYAESQRMAALKDGLRQDRSVTRSLYDAGFNSSSRVYETAGPQLGMTPAQYRKGGAGMDIRFTIADSPLGRMLIAATERGVCAIQFGDSDAELEGALRAEFRAANIERGGLAEETETMMRHLEGSGRKLDLPLDIQATAFQRRVWEYLRGLDAGETRSYSQVAEAIGAPRAARAVARACASNRIAVAIPCHRIVRENGEMGGYRWGIARKQALLEKERSSQ